MTRVNVPLRYAYRLLNHDPTTLVTTRAGDRTNLMSAQWVMPLDFDPPVLAIVVESTSYTRPAARRIGRARTVDSGAGSGAARVARGLVLGRRGRQARGRELDDAS